MRVIRDLDRFNQEIERLKVEILRHLKKELYEEVVKEIKKDVGVGRVKIANAESPKYKNLLRAIRSGKITFYRGAFRGKFSSAVSREIKRLGGKWYKRDRLFVIPKSDLPSDVKTMIDTNESALKKKVKKIKERIAAIAPTAVAESFNASKILDTTIFKADASFKERIRDITVAPEMTKEARKQLTAEYNKNIKRSIKDWTKRETLALREEVEAFVLKGGRAEDLQKIIQKSYGESEARAKFIASQETRLMTAKFRETRYRSAGSEGYIWRTVKGSPKHPVRDTHKILDGKKFKWSDPPVTSKDGRRNHPGEDFNCRCYTDVLI